MCISARLAMAPGKWRDGNMQCILLAAGYATRLYPLTKDRPKPLLEVGGRTIMEHIVRKVEVCDEVERIYIVTNARFAEPFRQWTAWWMESEEGASATETISRDKGRTRKPIEVIDDGTLTNETRLGAIADIQYVLDEAGVDDDVLVLAGDNLFDFDLRDFIHYYDKVGHDCITAHPLHDRAALQRTGVVEVNAQGQVISFEEKPQEPRSNLAAPPFYLYRRETLSLIRQYLAEGGNPDAPGHLIPWLIDRTPVYAYEFQGKRHDIGTLESYEAAQRLFGSGFTN